MGYLLASPLRRRVLNPQKLLAPYIREGMTVLEPGPGMGFFTLELLRLVGPSGRVVAVDLQPRMLSALRRRATKAGLDMRLDARLCERDSMGIGDLDERVDFTLLFAVVHEAPAAGPFFVEVSRALQPDGSALLAEPMGHVKRIEFDDEVAAADRAGLRTVERPAIRRSYTALLTRRASADVNGMHAYAGAYT
jgi:SAM-dependent methyltransferase